MLSLLPFFFFNDTATTEIYTLSLHDALPISGFLVHPPAAPWELSRKAGEPGSLPRRLRFAQLPPGGSPVEMPAGGGQDRKSTRLNSSHANISYAVFCLKKQNLQPPLTSTAGQ